MIFYFFIDGIGYGKRDPDKNPFTRYSRSVFRPLGNLPSVYPEFIYLETDAAMGVSGLPQSATGQTSLWTGLSAPRFVGRHINGFPTFTLKKIISKYSIVKRIQESGKKADLLNSYTDYYFQKIRRNPRYQSASTLVQVASGNPLKTLDDLREFRGLYMDITHRILKEISRDWLDPEDSVLNYRNPRWVGSQVPTWFQDYDFTIFEYFLTDKAGHEMNWDYARQAISDLEDFIEGIVESMNPSKDSLIVTSDHGNLEDLSTDRHTSHSVPTILYGDILKENPFQIKALSDIPKYIYKYLKMKETLEELERAEKQIQI